MTELFLLPLITAIAGVVYGYILSMWHESGWKQMYLDEQKKRVAAEESKDEVHAYAMRLENRLIAQQKDLESLQGVVEMQTGKSRLGNNVEKQK